MTRAGTYFRYGDPSWDSPEPVEPAAAEVSRAPISISPSPLRADVPPLPMIDLSGVAIHAINERETIGHILGEIAAGRGGVVVTPNLDHIRRCRTDPYFEALVAEADLVVADGMPLVWASRLQGTPLPERVAGSNLINTLSAAAALQGRSVFMLGGAEGTAEGAAKVLQANYPGLRIGGWYCPPVGFERNKRVMAEMRAALAASGADIVYVALGSPKQERLISAVRSALPRAWWLGVGNSFSFLCGHVKRAPLWMQRHGVEWIHRLCQEPRRLFKRYVLVGVPFGCSLLFQAAGQGFQNLLGRRRSSAGVRRPAALPDVAPDDGPLDFAPPPPAAGAAPVGAVEPVLAEPDMRVSPDDSCLGLAPPTLAARYSNGAGGRDGVCSPRLDRVRAVVLLGGAVRPSPLTVATGRSVLDLPLDEDGSLFNYWLTQAADVGWTAGLDRLPVRVLVNGSSLEPVSAREAQFGPFRVERDLSEYRGTGGVLRDVAAEYEDDDLILVANAAQILLEPLAAIATALDRQGGDVCLVSHDDGTPSGVMLLSCKALRLIPGTGFVDMKEQVLPLISSRFDVRVVRRRRPTGLPVRTLEDYIQALRFHHRRRAGKPISTDPLAEDFSPAFSLVQAGAKVDPAARVHDSVVLAGGVVEPGAVLVRCVVCPNAVVARDRTAVDQFLTAPPRQGDRKLGAARRIAAM